MAELQLGSQVLCLLRELEHRDRVARSRQLSNWGICHFGVQVFSCRKVEQFEQGSTNSLSYTPYSIWTFSFV